jgi:hypothetical protein
MNVHVSAQETGGNNSNPLDLFEYKSLTQGMKDEEIQILNEMNQTRLRQGLPHLAPNSLLNRAANTHLSRLVGRGANVGAPNIDGDQNIEDWLEAANYPGYQTQNNRYAPDIASLVSNPGRGLEPSNIIAYWIDNPNGIISYRMGLNGSNTQPFYQRAYREVGIAYQRNISNGRQYFVMIFASQRNALPVVVAEPAIGNIEELAKIRNQIASQNAILYISNEYAYPNGDNSIGTAETIYVTELRQPNLSCPESMSQLPEGWENYNYEYEITLSQGAGQKTIFVYFCDAISRMVVTSTFVNLVEEAGVPPTFDQPTPVPVTQAEVDDLSATETAITGTQTQTALDNTGQTATAQQQAIQTQQSWATATQETRQTEIAVAGATQTQQYSDRLATVQQQQREVHQTETQSAMNIQATEAAINETANAQMTMDAILQATANAPTPVPSLTFTPILTNTPIPTPTISPSSTHTPVSTSTDVPVTPTTIATSAPIVPTSTPTTEANGSTSTDVNLFLNLRWNQLYILIHNPNSTEVDLSSLVAFTTEDNRVSSADWQNYLSSGTLSPGGCLILYSTEADINSSTATPEPANLPDQSDCRTQPVFAEINPNNAVWSQVGQPGFIVRYDGRNREVCEPAEQASCRVNLNRNTDLPPTETPTPTTIEALWTPGVFAIRNISGKTINLSDIRLSSTAETFVPERIASDVLERISPNTCIRFYAPGQSDVPNPANIECANTLDEELENYSNVVWTDSGGFSVNVRGTVTQCDSGRTRCEIKVP